MAGNPGTALRRRWGERATWGQSRAWWQQMAAPSVTTASSQHLRLQMRGHPFRTSSCTPSSEHGKNQTLAETLLLKRTGWAPRTSNATTWALSLDPGGVKSTGDSHATSPAVWQDFYSSPQLTAAVSGSMPDISLPQPCYKPPSHSPRSCAQCLSLCLGPGEILGTQAKYATLVLRRTQLPLLQLVLGCPNSCLPLPLAPDCWFLDAQPLTFPHHQGSCLCHSY